MKNVLKIFNNIKKKKILNLIKKDSFIKNNICKINKEFKKKQKNIISVNKKTLEICGSGGDCKNTFNISSSILLILLFLNIKIVKQGSSSYTSGSGSLDFIKNLLKYYKFEDLKYIKEIYKKIKFLFLPSYMFYNKNFFPKSLIEFRKKIKKYSIFNYTIPFTNPFNSKICYCCIGNIIFKKKIIKILKKNYSKFILVCSYDRMDEASLFNYIKIYKFEKNKIFRFLIKSDFLFLKGNLKDITSHNLNESLKIFFKSLINHNDSSKNIIIIGCSIIMKFMKFSKNFENSIIYLKKKFSSNFFLNKYIRFKKKIKCLSIE
ncbi:hypothetical protein ACWNYI_00220 [Candidatus Vidania fulgoroideorum]